MKKIAFFLLLMTLSPSGQAETLVEVIQHTLKTNPEVLITTHNRRAADQQFEQAKGGYWPSLELAGGYGRETSENTSTRNVTGGDLTLTRREFGLTLSQMLFDGFDVKYRVAQQESLVNSAAYKVQDSSENIALITAEVYLEILRRRELVELSKDNVVIHQKTLEQINTLVKGGAGRQADTQQSASRLALAKSRLVSAQGHLRNAEINYKRVTGELPNVLTMPVRAPIEAALPATPEAALDIAWNKHPSLRVAKSDLTAAQAAHKQTKSAFMPHLSLDLGMSKNKNLDGVEGEHDDQIAMLRMRYNLYRGGADKARRQETAERIGAALEERRRIQRIIEEEVYLSWNSLTTVQARLAYLREHLKSTEQVLNSYKEQFKLGKRSLLDVLDSENELFNARASFVSAQHLEILSLLKILKSMGVLLGTLEIRRPHEAVPKALPWE